MKDLRLAEMKDGSLLRYVDITTDEAVDGAVRFDLDERTFSGYASTFEAAKNYDPYGTIFAKGAFLDTIKDDGPDGSDEIRVYYNHDDLIGVPRSMKEDRRGLLVEGYISKTRQGDDILAMIDDKTLKRMSFRFDPVEATWIDRVKTSWGSPVLRFDKVKVIEFGPVERAANKNAMIKRSVEEVRSRYNQWVVGADLTPNRPRAAMITTTEDFLRGLADRLGSNAPSTQVRRRLTGCQVGVRGESLAAALESGIEGKIDDDNGRSDVIEAMATAAGISAGTVRSILSGEINCPPVDRLEGFARALDVSLNSLISAAESDGCSYGDDDDE